RLRLGLETDRGIARLSVQDCGTGIPADVLSRIFDPFFTTKGPDRGTGLGLSVTMSIVKQHQGHIHVQSSPGQATVFHVELPLMSHDRPKPVAARPAVAPPKVNLAGAVLVIDDERPAALMLERALWSRLGCRTEVASDGRQAIDRLQRGAYAAVVS